MIISYNFIVIHKNIIFNNRNKQIILKLIRNKKNLYILKIKTKKIIEFFNRIVDNNLKDR